MPYAAPAAAEPAARAHHRRTRSSNAASPADAGAGAFQPLPSLPRRRSAKKSSFFLSDDDEPSPEEELERAPLSVLGLHIDTRPAPSQPSHDRPQSIPFPRSSGPASPPLSRPPSDLDFQPPSLSRTNSSTVFLSNGKPLKPSLKSQSFPDIPDELRHHLRAKSEPSTPSVKSVHFRDEDDLEEVRVYNRTGRPANLLTKTGEETETETEAEPAFPFPVQYALGGSLPSPSAAHAHDANVLPCELDAARTSVVPRRAPDAYGHIHLESLALPRTRPAALTGTVLVRNLTFEKQVAVRFTFDDWQTTSEVFCKHVCSVPGLPPPFPRSRTAGLAETRRAARAAQAAAAAASDAADGSASLPSPIESEPTDEDDNDPSQPAWDRFSFHIRLEDYVARLADKKIWMVARYAAPGVGEFWDNNEHSNYRVEFKRAPPPAPAPAPAAADPVPRGQQRSFVAPATLRTTPLSSSAESLAGHHSGAPADRVPTFPHIERVSFPSGPLAPLGKRGSPTQRSPAGSPRLSPNGSPSGSDAEGRAGVVKRAKPNMGLGLGLGTGLAVGAAGGAQSAFARPPGMARSMSSPPVYAPTVSGETAQPFLGSAAGSAAGASASLSPLMARLSRLSLSNYAAPAPPAPAGRIVKEDGAVREPRSRSGSLSMLGGMPATMIEPDSGALLVPELTVTASTPVSPPLSEQAQAQREREEAKDNWWAAGIARESVRSSPSSSANVTPPAERRVSTSPTRVRVAAGPLDAPAPAPAPSPPTGSPTSSSATASPLLETPSIPSVENIPALGLGHAREPAHVQYNGSSNGAPHGHSHGHSHALDHAADSGNGLWDLNFKRGAVHPASPVRRQHRRGGHVNGSSTGSGSGSGGHTQSGSDSSSSSSHSSAHSSVTQTAGSPRVRSPRPTFKPADLVLNMPAPSARGAGASPFSPVATPKFAPLAVADGGASGAPPGGPRARVDTNDADYAAFVRQWCFAQSPSPGGTPLVAPVAVPAPAREPSKMRELMSPTSTSPQTSPVRGSAGNSPDRSPTYTPPFERNAWLGMGEGYGLSTGIPERGGWEAGRA